MIAALTGELRHVHEDRIHLQAGPMLYELLVPAADVPLLQAGVGEEMTFHTLFYLEGDASGGNMQPRLIGFLRAEDKKFFEKFITVKGIGPKKALRPDLPGRRDRPGDRVQGHAVPGGAAADRQAAWPSRSWPSWRARWRTSPRRTSAAGRSIAGAGGRNPVEEEAIAVLIALGERRPDAEHLLDRARQVNPTRRTPTTCVREMLRMRQRPDLKKKIHRRDAEDAEKDFIHEGRRRDFWETSGSFRLFLRVTSCPFVPLRG